MFYLFLNGKRSFCRKVWHQDCQEKFKCNIHIKIYILKYGSEFFLSNQFYFSFKSFIWLNFLSLFSFHFIFILSISAFFSATFSKKSNFFFNLCMYSVNYLYDVDTIDKSTSGDCNFLFGTLNLVSKSPHKIDKKVISSLQSWDK